MSKVLKIISVVAAVVATVAEIAFLVTGNPLFATIATIASIVSAVSGAAAALTQKPPDLKGTVNEVVIGANLPVPCGIGRTYVGGMKVYDDSANGTGGAPNKDRTQIMVGSIGPIDSFENFYADFEVVPFSGSTWNSSRVATGYYGADGGYMWLNTRVGLLGETALSAFPGRSAFTGWGTSYKLSGLAAWSVTMEFDEEGERYASGIPAFGMVAKWAKVYDPRLDSTYPGGAGTQRWADESTWAWSENPALHALTYARGRFQNSIKVFGVGLPQSAINLVAFVELANICDANGWTAGGFIYEGPNMSKWDNLKRILQACAADPAWVKGELTVRASSPKTALTTITADQLADGDIEIQAMSGWKDRVNTVVPRYRSEPHKWDYVQADAVENPTYLIEDGESKTTEIQFDLVQDVDQAAQLAAYEIVNRREFGPISITCKNHLRHLLPGEAVDLDIPEAGLNGQLCVITSRSVDPATGSVQFQLYSETNSKHSYVLGLTGVAPPTPSIATAQEIDTAVKAGNLTTADITLLISNSTVNGMSFSVGAPSSGNSSVVINSHSRVYPDKTVTVAGATISVPAASGDLVLVYYDDPTRAGGAVTYQALVLAAAAGDPTPAYPTATHPYRHFIAAKTVPASGTSSGGSDLGSGGGGPPPPGGGGGLGSYY